MELSIEYTYRVRWWNHVQGYPYGPADITHHRISYNIDSDNWNYVDYLTLQEAEDRMRLLRYDSENIKQANSEILIQAKIVQKSEWEKYEGQDK